MRGGALPILAWGALLLVLFAGNWAWSGQTVDVLQTCLSLLLVGLFAMLLWLASRQAIRRGPPPQRPRDVERIPELSLGALGAALSIGCAALGAAFGHFLIYFGAGLFVASLARLAIELRSARRTARDYRLKPLPQQRGDAYDTRSTRERATREAGS